MTALTQDDREPTTTSGDIAVANLNAQIDGLARAAPQGTIQRSKDSTPAVRRTGPPGRPAAPSRAGAGPGRRLRASRGAGRGTGARRAGRRHGSAGPGQDAGHLPPLRRGARRPRRRGATRRGPGRAGRGAGGDPPGGRVLTPRPSRCAGPPRSAGPTSRRWVRSPCSRPSAGRSREAERLFTAARRHYRGVSPFPVAELEFRRGLMWLGERDLPAARAWFDAAVRRVPAYAPALGHLAEVDAALGAAEAAIDRLRPLAVSSDDPEYAATLAGVLGDAGRPLEAEHWRISAAARYDELVRRHPEAFARSRGRLLADRGRRPAARARVG